MTRAWQNRIDVGCAFCGVVLAIDVAPTGGGAVQAPKRDTLVAKVKCTACDSITELWLQTKRRGKGKRLRAQEAAAKARLAELVAGYEADNEDIARQLLAEPGCICAEVLAERRRQGIGTEWRADGLRSMGHGQRDGHHMMPLKPTHRFECPARKASS